MVSRLRLLAWPSHGWMLESLGLALAGRAGARLAARLGVTTSRSSVLRIVRAIPEVPVTG